MAKSRIDEWLENDKLILLEGWARDGLTQEQIAHNMGIGLTTLKEWRKKEPTIEATLKKGKEVADYEVENALFKKALGYNVPLRKAFKVKEVIYENGKRLKETERIEYANEEMHVPADTTAQIFWLKNRKKKEWRDKVEVENTNTKNGVMDDLVEALKNVKNNQ